MCVVALKNSSEEICRDYLNEILPYAYWSVVGSSGCLPMLFLLSLSIVQIVMIVSGNENQIMASLIATFGLIFYLASGAALLKHVVAFEVREKFELTTSEYRTFYPTIEPDMVKR